MLYRNLLFAFLLLASAAAPKKTKAQTAPTVTTRQVQFQLVNPPATTSSASASRVGGQTGPATYYYWIVTRFLVGNSAPYGPVIVTSAPSTLSGPVYNAINWQDVAAPPTSDRLRPPPPTPPPAPCNRALAR